MKPLEVMVTSGGTIAKIDDVRHIGNFSKGTTGALIAEEFLRAGAVVRYVHNRQSRKPFISRLDIDPALPLEDEIERIRAVHGEFQLFAGNLHEYPFETFHEYYETIKELLASESIDAVVLAAAVSDYGVKQQEGKLSSDLDEVTLTLVRNPKVISLVKEWNPRVFQVGFKLLAEAGIEELIDTAYRHGIKNHSNLTVANTIYGGDFKQRATVLITPEKGMVPISLSELAPELVKTVTRRVSKRHYRTQIKVDPSYQDMLSDEMSDFKAHVGRLHRLNLFEPYFQGSDMEFGFLATRVPSGGFLITGRGSNKAKMPPDHIVHVTGVDFEGRTLYVTSNGKKASLNANVAAKLFEERPDSNVIFHAHVFPGIENRTSIDYAPGTEEDVQEVTSRFQNGERIVELHNHGIIALGESLDEAIATLDVEPAYTKFPELYDAIYHRFQQSPDFLKLVSLRAGPDERVLDLAAGTGDVTAQLLQQGYRNVSIADRSDGMLNVALEKAGCTLPAYVTSMEDLYVPEEQDAIIIRQAINYLMTYEGFVTGASRMHDVLASGGRLIFNAPNFTGSEDYTERTEEYNYDGWQVRVKEMNLVEGRTLTHTQNCLLIRKDGSDIRRVYDLNRFGLFTKDEFIEGLREAGFSRIDVLGKGLREHSPDSRTLYIVAEK